MINNNSKPLLLTRVDNGQKVIINPSYITDINVLKNNSTGEIIGSKLYFSSLIKNQKCPSSNSYSEDTKYFYQSIDVQENINEVFNMW